MLHSIYDLTTLCRRTSGDVPPKLVGASTTVIGSKMYLFGGRLVTERRMVSDLYVFDMETYEWEFVPPYPDDDIPQPRYFHSTDAWNNHLVLFGGMSNQPDSPNPEDLCVLNDVRFFDLETKRWLPATPSDLPPDDPRLPRARYAHLSSVTANRLFIIGGQDFYNTWLDDICVYDLIKRTWVQKRDYPRHCGTYRSVAVASTTTVHMPQDEMQVSHASSTLGPAGTRFQQDKTAPLSDVTPSDTLIHLPYTAEPTDEHPSNIFLYSNYNFTDVKRELEVFSPLPESDFIIEDRSNAMTGTSFPPGLRFPTGAVLGTHLIIAGTYLAHSYQSFSIWVLDLTTMAWSRIDPGKAIEAGSWFRGCLWTEGNKFLIFGNRNGNLVDDYNRRLLSWDHVAVVDLEAFGIYQPPPLELDLRMQELGLATLEESTLTDFEVVCDDGRKIPCSRRILEERWPWFKLQRTRMLEQAQAALTQLPTSAMHIPLPSLPGTATIEEPQLDPRLTPRALFLSEPWPVTMALLQYFYSLALITPLQHAPAVLSQLLVLGTNYQLDHLVSLVKHAMHRALSNSTSVGVYEVATLCSCRSLQIRALKTVMSYTQKRPSKSRHDKDTGHDRYPDSGPGDLNGDNGSHGPSSHGDSSYSTRPRGTSDAHWRSGDTNGNSLGYTMRGGNVLSSSIAGKQEETPTIREKTTYIREVKQYSGSCTERANEYSCKLSWVPTQNHMAEETLKYHTPQSSDEWSLISSVPSASAFENPSLSPTEPLTPSRKHIFSQILGTANHINPKLESISSPSHGPSMGRTFKYRLPPIFTGIPSPSHNKGKDSVDYRHVPKLSTSSSQSSISVSSSSHEAKTPATPAWPTDPRIPRIQDQSPKHRDEPDDFTIVLDQNEAIHWTRQTSDLRHASPKRPIAVDPKATQSPSYFSSPLYKQGFMKSPLSPIRLSPTDGHFRQPLLEEKIKNRFSLSPKSNKSLSPVPKPSKSRREQI